MPANLSRIRIYPIKSLDGQDVDEAVVLRSGALAHDREFCLVDPEGRVYNGKRSGDALLPVRSDVDLARGEVTLSLNGAAAAFHPERALEGLAHWFSERLGDRVGAARDAEGGCPDDTEAHGPTVVSTETLREVASWFPDMDVEEARRRFRANLEIDGVPAFWEDRLFGDDGETVRFQIGDVTLEGVNPCARCPVPSRDSRTGVIHDSAFAQIFSKRRAKLLPKWARRGRFDHFYRLSVNTRIAESQAGNVLARGDAVTVER
jgi:uncharacterized protein YcbX